MSPSSLLEPLHEFGSPTHTASAPSRFPLRGARGKGRVRRTASRSPQSGRHLAYCRGTWGAGPLPQGGASSAPSAPVTARPFVLRPPIVLCAWRHAAQEAREGEEREGGQEEAVALRSVAAAILFVCAGRTRGSLAFFFSAVSGGGGLLLGLFSSSLFPLSLTFPGGEAAGAQRARGGVRRGLFASSPWPGEQGERRALREGLTEEVLVWVGGFSVQDPPRSGFPRGGSGGAELGPRVRWVLRGGGRATRLASPACTEVFGACSDGSGEGPFLPPPRAPEASRGKAGVGVDFAARGLG